MRRTTKVTWLVTLAIVAALAARFLHWLWHAQDPVHGASAIGNLRSIADAQTIFREKEDRGAGRYASLAQLTSSTLVDSVLGSGTKSGYTFVVQPSTTT